MIKRLMTRFVQGFVRTVFHDPVRMLELFSALNLLAWVKVLHFSPDIFMRDNYQTFDGIPQDAWLAIFAAISSLQMFGIFWDWRFRHEVRFIGFAFAAGAWSSVAISFMHSGISTTAELNYVLLAIGCMLSGAFLGWKRHY